MDLNSSEDEDEPLPVTRVTEGVREARTTRTGSTHITSDLVALPNPRPRSECSSRLSSVRKWEVGDRVRARYGARLHGPAGTKWFPGTISATHDDGACDVAYDDGDFETQVPAACIKPGPVEPTAAVLTVKEEPAATELVATADVDRMDQHSGPSDGHTQPATATDPLTKSGAKIDVGPRVARAGVLVPVPVPTRTLPARERKAVVSYEAGPAPPPAQLALAARSLAHYRASQGAPTPEGQDSPTKTQSSAPANRAAAAAAGRDSDSDGRGLHGGPKRHLRPRVRRLHDGSWLGPNEDSLPH